MASCSSDEPGKGQDENDGGDVKYLAVQIVTPTASGSRADGDFEAGSTTENEIKTIRFYFFNESGNAVTVKSGATDNTYDYTVTAADIKKTENEGTNTNVEKLLNAIIVIDTKKGDKLPARVLAVANPTVDGQGSTIASLRGYGNDYAGYANNLLPAENPKRCFVMSNSVYLTENSKNVIAATNLSISDFKETEEAAKNSPVDIYIERNVAKVRAYLSATQTNGLIKAQEKIVGDDNTTSEKGITAIDTENNESKDIYIKILGWSITADTKIGRLSKYFDLNWNVNELPSPYNDFTNNRSYWAANHPDAENRYDTFNAIISDKNSALDSNGNATDIKGSGLTLGTSTTSMNSIYANENAGKIKSIEDTKIIVAAQLCDQSGNPLTVCEYLGTKVIGTDALKNLMLQNMSSIGYDGSIHTHWRKETIDGATKWTKLGPDDIEIVYFNNPVNPNNTRYPVKLKLKNAAESYKWYTYGKQTEPTSTDYPQEDDLCKKGEIDNHLEALGKAKVWTNGAAYYYAPIKHDTKKKINGVVRNHIYEIDINGFYGLGTPVYDPTKVIIPEDPQENQGYLAVQIRVLSWRVKTQQVIFGDK